MGNLRTQREFATAHHRRARIIAQLHQQAIATANAQHKTKKPEIAKDAARWQKAEAWAFVVGTVLLALGWIFAIGWFL